MLIQIELESVDHVLADLGEDAGIGAIKPMRSSSAVRACENGSQCAAEKYFFQTLFSP